MSDGLRADPQEGTESLFHARSWIDRCDRIFDGRREDGRPTTPDREFAYQQMRQLAVELLSQLGLLGTHLGDNNEREARDAEDTAWSDEGHSESTDGDAEQRGEAAVSGVRPEVGDESGGRRFLPVEGVPVVPVALGAGRTDHVAVARPEGASKPSSGVSRG